MSVTEAEALARPEDFDTYEKLGEHYSAMRRWATAFLATGSFQGVPAAASLLRAVHAVEHPLFEPHHRGPARDRGRS